MYLPLLVRLIHIIIIILILIGPFILKDKRFLQLYIISVFSIIIHWFCNNDICVLTMIEKYLTNDYSNTTFLSSIISPVYKPRVLNETILTYILLFITIIKYLKFYGLSFI